MKTPLKLGLILLMTGCLSAGIAQNHSTQDTKTTVKVSSAPDLYPLIHQWAKDYNVAFPTMNVQAIESVTIKLTENSTTFVSEKNLEPGLYSNAWRMLVGRDVWVPIIHSQHPYLDAIYAQGISLPQLKSILSSNDNTTWHNILGNKGMEPVSIYIDDEPILQSSVEALLQMKSEAISLIHMGGSAEILQKIKENPASIGFCRLTDVLDPSGTSLLEDLTFLPFDLNGNARLDQMENFYENPALLYRAVWLGKYPRALVQNIYAIAPQAPTGDTELAFMNWVITQGDAALNHYGHMGLVYSELPSKLGKLNESGTIPLIADQSFSVSRLLVILLFGMLVFIIFMEFIIRVQKRRNILAKQTIPGEQSKFDPEAMGMPEGMYFSDSHTWTFLERDGSVRVGIDDFLPHITGQITRTQLKGEGESIRKGEPILTLIQHGKQLQLNSPITGRITSFNAQLLDDPDLVSSSPYTEGWVYLIQPFNWLREVEFLQPGKKYRPWINKELKRLKDFLMHSNGTNQADPLPVALQDGGEIMDHVLSSMGPEIWADFQTHFLDTKK